MKKIKKNTNTLSDKDRKFGVLIESMDKNIKQILEGHESTNLRIDRLHNEFIEFKHETKLFQNEMYSFRDEMYSFRDDTKSNFKTLQVHLSLIDDELKSKPDTARLEKLETRVHGLEIKITG